jgi:hypothetical protein
MCSTTHRLKCKGITSLCCYTGCSIIENLQNFKHVGSHPVLDLFLLCGRIMKPWCFISKKQIVIKPEIRCTYQGLLKKITSVEFVLDLGLMCDALQELSELSLDLQHRDIDLYKADKKIKTR